MGEGELFQNRINVLIRERERGGEVEIKGFMFDKENMWRKIKKDKKWAIKCDYEKNECKEREKVRVDRIERERKKE